MRPLFVLPAVVVPLAVVALLAAARRIGDAANDLRHELGASAVTDEVAALSDDLSRLERRQSRRQRSLRDPAPH